MKETIAEIIRSAFSLPPNFGELRIRDAVPSRGDWDDHNAKLCSLLVSKGLTITQYETDIFWINNETFASLVDFVDGKSYLAGPHGPGQPPPEAGPHGPGSGRPKA